MLKYLIPLIFLATSSILYADDNQEETTVCSLISDIDTSSVADEFGKRVFTKRIRKRKCVNTITTKGDCIKYESLKETYKTEKSIDYSEVETKDYSKTMGEMMAALGATSGSVDILSGWNGYCIDGLIMDFSWAKDPYMWSNMAIGSFMALGGESMISSAIQESSDVAVKTAEKIAKYASCAASNASQLVQTVNDYLDEGLDGPPCNPVDEICEESEEDVESNIMSIERKSYTDIVEQNPDMADMIEILEDENSNSGTQPSDSDIIIVKVKSSSELDMNVDSEEIDKMRNKLKTVKAAIGAASYAANMATCMLSKSGARGKGSATKSGKDGILMDATKQSLASVAGFFGGPFGSMGATLLMNTATSFQNVNTCSNKKDAEDRGGRHVATQSILKSNHPDMCKRIKGDICAQKDILGNCTAHGKTYCCYDSPMARYLMAQIKAQLGKDWSSCSDLMLKELNDVNLQECSESDKSDGEDGGSDKWTIDYANSIIASEGYKSYHEMAMDKFYQAKHSCINYDDLKKYYQVEFKGIIDQDSLNNQINNLFSMGK